MDKNLDKLIQDIKYNYLDNMNTTDLNARNNVYKSIKLIIRTQSTDKLLKNFSILKEVCSNNDRHKLNQIKNKLNFLIKIIEDRYPEMILESIVNEDSNPRPKIQTTHKYFNKKNISQITIPDLDTLKVQGLRDLCVKLGLDTNGCSLRKHYVGLIKKFKTNKVNLI